MGIARAWKALVGAIVALTETLQTINANLRTWAQLDETPEETPAPEVKRAGRGRA
jgi:hypothetical protein